jgi:hypothetical protein
MIEKLLHLDRRVIFVFIALAVGVPMVGGWKFDQGSNPRTTAVHKYIEDLPDRSVVLLCFDYGPASMPELQPMALAIAQHVLSRDLRLVCMTTYPDAPLLIEDTLATVVERLEKEKGIKREDGKDYVNLGYRPGLVNVILGMSADIGAVWKTDFNDRRYGDLAVTKGVRTFKDVGLVIDLASSSTPGAWVVYAHERYKVKVACGVTAVMAQDYYPYLQTHQLVGMLNGMKGAAEYEKLVGLESDASKAMGPQSCAHFLIIALVIFGNIVYAVSRRRARRQTP